jgi:hypothetical protein
MALAKGTNSYVTVSEANAFFENRLSASSWDDADDTAKAQSLMTATSILDSLHWQGVILSETQELAFPRNGEYFDTFLGYNVTFGNTVPKRITHATFELALHLLVNPDLLEDSGKATDIAVGAISLSRVSSANLLPSTVRRLIRPLLADGNRSWWRAN